MTLKCIESYFSLGCRFHVHFSNLWQAFTSHGLLAIASCWNREGVPNRREDEACSFEDHRMFTCPLAKAWGIGRNGAVRDYIMLISCHFRDHKALPVTSK